MRKKRMTRYWSKEEEDVLREWYGRIPTPELAKALNRSAHSVQQKARMLGLRFPEGQVDYQLLKKLTEIYEG